MRIVEEFRIKSHRVGSGREGQGLATLRPNSLRGFKTGSLVSIAKSGSRKRIYCKISTDAALMGNDIGIDFVLQKDIGISVHREKYTLVVTSRSWPYSGLFWMRYPNAAIRVPLVVTVVGTVFGAIAVIDWIVRLFRGM